MMRTNRLPAMAVALAVVFLLALTSLSLAGEAKLSPHPRVILTPVRAEKLRNVAKGGDARAKALADWGDARLQSKTKEYLTPGYGRVDWAEDACNYALLYVIESDAAKRKAYADESIVYMKALADDLEKVGDGKGGLPAVQADGGYAIRNHAVGIATCYDWLHDYEGLTPDLRKHFVERLNAWIDWYEGADGSAGGYQLKGKPWDDYFTGYYLAKTLTAAATYEDNQKARDAYLQDAVAKMKNDILPALSNTLTGGYCPSGWYYRCGYDRTADALVTLSNATGETFDTGFFPFVVRAVIHSTKPDRRRIYDGGDWGGDFSGYPLPLPLMARVSLLLQGSPAGEYAAFYVDDFAIHDRFNNLSLLDSLLYRDPDSTRTDFTKTEPLSYFSAGAGLATFRSSWSDKAFWGSFQSGAPQLADHQNRDQGHITIDYFGAELLIDAGMWRELLPNGKTVNNFASDTKWHNTIMIDDLGKQTGLSQGPFGERKTLAFEDGGSYVYASADITGAYASDPSKKTSNSAKRVTRDILYLRPATIAMMDYVEPSDPSYPRSILFNFPGAARLSPAATILTEFQRGAILKIFSVSSEEAPMEVFERYGMREGDRENDVATLGLAIPGKPGDAKTRFMTVLSAAKGVKDEEFNGFAPFYGGTNGVVMKSDQINIAAMWATRGSTSYTVPLPNVGEMDVYILGLAPGKAYAVTLQPQNEGQLLALTVQQAPKGTQSSAAGVLFLHLAPKKKP